MLFGDKFCAVHTQGALTAFGVSGSADFPAEQYDPMAEITAFLRRENDPELPFHLFWVLALGQAQPPADSNAVGVADHTAWCTVEVTQQKVGGLAANTGELQQFIHGARHLAAVFLQKHLTG